VTEVLVTFGTSHAALAAEQALRGQDLPVELIPVPRQLRSDCGFCLLAEAGEPGSPEAESRLRAFRTCNPQALWRVLVTPAGASTRKVKTYERIP